MNQAFSIGVDLGGTNLRIGAMRENGEFLETVSLPTRLAAGRDAVIADLGEAVIAMQKRHACDGRCVGIGIGMPGPLELPAGVLRRPPNLPGWNGMDVRTAIEERLGQPILLNSDGNLAALAELRLGAGRAYGVASLCMLTLGTGVGSGIVLEGHIWQGMSGMAGEAGHITVVPDGALCGCGSCGCLEQYASATAVRRLAAEMAERFSQTAPQGRASQLAASIAENPAFRSQDVAQWAEAGNREAAAVFEEVGKYLGLALAALVNTLNLPLYVIGGGTAAAWPLFEQAMMRELRERSYVFRATDPAWRESSGPPVTRVVPAALGSGSGLQGAALLPFAELRDQN